MTRTADFALSPLEFDVLWSGADAGAPPFPLSASVHGQDVAEWERIRETTLADLRGRASHRGVEDLLPLLVAPRLVVDSIGYADGPLRAVAAGGAHSAVLAEVFQERVELTEIRPTALVGAVVDHLPDVDAATGHSITLRYRDLARATSEDDTDDPLGIDDETDALVRAGVSEEDAERLVRLAENRIRGGQLGVSALDRTGALRRSEVLISWFDTPSGRYMMVRDGEWVSISPASRSRIAHRVKEVLDAETRVRT
ncbi:ESX secretion-associated protein EspG [Saccharopolyspora rosea]|uniref:ESX secretion-associated protein EspG n=1 Tax=Saccharopolyspora rosea TaxID=524884 RepID=A0ABW3FZM3_9PSEU|nr:ESX secretion-associated protein EspG [Saccharopolyspora rosea]